MKNPIKLSVKEKLLESAHMHYNRFPPLLILLGSVLGMASEAPHPHVQVLCVPASSQ